MAVVNGVAVVFPPPKDYVVNFENPARNGLVAGYLVIGIGNLLALLFVAQRLYVKVIVRRTFGWDDLCLVLAWVGCILQQSFILRSWILKHIGVHSWEIPLTEFKQFYKYNVYVTPIMFTVPTALAKLALLLFYLQLNNQDRWFRLAVYFTIFVNVGSNLSIFFGLVFACKPIAMGWDLTITDGTCIDRVALFKFTAVIGIIVDLLIIAIPMPMIHKLQMSRSKKVALIIMFVLGSATFVTSIIRLQLLITSLGKTDQPWGGGPINTWVAVEGNLMIMCAALPTLRHFFRIVAPRLFPSTLGSSNKTKPSRYAGSSLSRGVPTIGGSGHSREPKSKWSQYGRFDDDLYTQSGADQYELNNATSSDKSANNSERRLPWSSGPSGQDSPRFEDGRDDNSEKGILRTKTTTITYE